MDSRLIEKNDLFLAINNGNKFIGDVLEKGASLVICDNEEFKVDNEKVIVVEDTVEFMQELAKQYREILDIVIIGITGTNGKTTTKDLLYSVLSSKYKCLKTQGNHNNHIGLPFTILQIEESHEVAILEMGMSGFGEIDLLCEISKPDYGIITNIGESHLEFLKTVENVFKAKTEMVKYIAKNKRFFFSDEQYLDRIESVKIGFFKENDYYLKDIQETDEGVKFSLNENEYFLPITGEHNAINASFAIAIGEELEIPNELIKDSLLKSQISGMRNEKLLKGEKLYINDAYNADPLSMKSSLLSFGKLYNSSYKVVVLGDMLELGEKSKDYHVAIKSVLKEIKINLAILYGTEMKHLYNALKNEKTLEVEYYSEKSDIKKKLESIQGKTTIFLKGSRGMKLEELI